MLHCPCGLIFGAYKHLQDKVKILNKWKAAYQMLIQILDKSLLCNTSLKIIQCNNFIDRKCRGGSIIKSEQVSSNKQKMTEC